MKAKINRMLSSLRSSPKLKKALIISLIALVGLYVFSIPTFSAGNLFRHSNYVCYALVGILGLVTIFSIILYSSFKVRPVLFLIPIFVLFAFIGTALYSHEYRSWLTLVLMAVVLFILFYAFRLIENKDTILLTLIASFTVFAITYIIVLRKEIFVLSNFGRMGEPFEHPNTLSAYMLIASLLTLYFVFFNENKFKYALLASQAMFLLIGLTTGSRVFIVFFIVILITFSIFRFRKNKWVLLGILAGILALIILLLTLPMLDNLRFRLFNGVATVFGTSSQPDNSVLQRSTWFSYGFTLGGQKFLTGYGVDGFANFSGVKTYSHSNLSEVVCNFGVIGTILFYLPIGWIGYSNIKKCNKYSPLIFVFIIYCILASFSNIFYYNKIYYIILSLSISILHEQFQNNLKKVLYQFFSKIKNKLCIKKRIIYYKYKLLKRKQIKNDFTILCNTCIGGAIYHRLGMQFTSPFINCWLNSKDFVKFLFNKDNYLREEMSFDCSGQYPIGYLKDIKIHFNHYSNKQEVIDCWNRRKKRILDKQYVIIRESENHFITEQEYLELSKLFYKVVVLTTRKVKNKNFVNLKLKKDEYEWKSDFCGLGLWEYKWNYFLWLR